MFVLISLSLSHTHTRTHTHTNTHAKTPALMHATTHTHACTHAHARVCMWAALWVPFTYTLLLLISGNYGDHSEKYAVRSPFNAQACFSIAALCLTSFEKQIKFGMVFKHLHLRCSTLPSALLGQVPCPLLRHEFANFILPTLKAFFEACSHNVSVNKQ